jgi:quinoprotein glucose dehydrogenase
VRPRRGSSRGCGLAYWTDGKEERIVTPGYRLVALDAKTGVPAQGFGTRGIVSRPISIRSSTLITSDVGLHVAPIVAKDTIIIGAAHRVSW